MKVDVYYNVHRKCLSVRSRERASYGRVVRHADSVLLRNCHFVVSEAGRQRVLKEKRKNVHAVVRGETFIPRYGNRLRGGINLVLDNPTIVTYNPYRDETFVDVETNEPIFKADIVIINGKDIAAFKKVDIRV